MFMSQASVPDKAPEKMPPNWESRLVSCKMAGWFADCLKTQSVVDFANCFAAWCVGWFALTCLLVVYLSSNPIFAMTGIFAGILCNSFWIAPYYMPWDFLVLFLYASAFFAYRAHKWWLIALIAILGGLVKETVLVTSLFLLAAPIAFGARLLSIIAIALFSQLLNGIICGFAQPDWQYSINHFSLFNIWKLWPVLGADAGILVLLPFLLWKRLDYSLIAVCIAFISLQALNDLMCGVFIELRNWLEMLPIGWVLASELIEGRKLKICS
jgi:hypothetical protein